MDEAGLRHDRRWMLIDPSGRFLSQRTHPRIALLRPELTADTLRVRAPAGPPLELPLEPPLGAPRVGPVRVWFEDRCAIDCGPLAAGWATTFMGRPCRIVRAADPEEGPRVSPAGFVRAGFADAEAAHLVAVASLADLNARLSHPLPMDRFRPNLVVGGAAPYEEDGWGRMRIGDVPARATRGCPRCAATTVDQDAGQARGPEPLRTLATYRTTADGQVAFGMNVRFDGAGTLRVGSRVTVGTAAS